MAQNGLDAWPCVTTAIWTALLLRGPSPDGRGVGEPLTTIDGSRTVFVSPHAASVAAPRTRRASAMRRRAGPFTPRL
jgi:hypothetical protein